MKVIVVGGGPSGFSAAMVARKTGADVTLIERTDMLGGLGLVAGVVMIGGWRVPLAEERALGGADLQDVFESIATHVGVKVPGAPGHENVTLYNVTRLDARMQKRLKESCVEVMLCKRASGIRMSKGSVTAVILSDGAQLDGDVFVDTTGGTTGLEACEKWGRGCVGCIMRCPTFGPLRGLVETKVPTVASKTPLTGNSVLVAISSLSENVQKELKEKGYVAIPVPAGVKADVQRFNAGGAKGLPTPGSDFMRNNLVIHDVGGLGKVIGIGSTLYAGSLRSFPGLEDAVIMQPAAGTRGHIVLKRTMALRDNSLLVDGFDNLLCAGTKSGPTGCLLDAIVTGDLAGYNAVKTGLGQSRLQLPSSLAVGAFVDFLGKATRSPDGVTKPYALMEASLLQTLGIYREDESQIVADVKKAGLSGVYETKLC